MLLSWTQEVELEWSLCGSLLSSLPVRFPFEDRREGAATVAGSPEGFPAEELAAASSAFGDLREISLLANAAWPVGPLCRLLRKSWRSEVWGWGVEETLRTIEDGGRHTLGLSCVPFGTGGR